MVAEKTLTPLNPRWSPNETVFPEPKLCISDINNSLSLDPSVADLQQ